MTRPHPILFLSEGIRGLADASWMYTLYRTSSRDKIRELRDSPNGDSSPVIVLPGLLAGDLSTSMIRGYLNYKNWDANGWSYGPNIPENDAWVHNMKDAMLEKMVKLHHNTGMKIHLVGWSLGGIYARELARDAPDLVQQVITMGSPIQDDGNRNSIKMIFESISKMRLDAETIDYHRQHEPPPVPCTALYSRNDGIVHWEACLEPEAENTNNIEIRSSHLGMGFHAEVLKKLSHILAEKPQVKSTLTPIPQPGYSL